MSFTAGQKVRASDLNRLNGEWATFTSTWAASGTAPAIGNGTIVGSYARVGTTIHFRISLRAGSTTTYGTGSYTFSLPVTAATISGTSTLPAWFGTAMCLDVSAPAYKTGILQIASAATACNVINTATGGFWGQTDPQTWANTDYLQLGGTYEAAS